MLERPEHGWTEITIGTFSDRASFLTDVPVDCLRAMITACRNECLPFRVRFDAEDREYFVELQRDRATITIDRDERNALTFPIDRHRLARELVLDISRNLDAWVSWNEHGMTDEMKRDRRRDLTRLLDDLKAELRAATTKFPDRAPSFTLSAKESECEKVRVESSASQLSFSA